LDPLISFPILLQAALLGVSLLLWILVISKWRRNGDWWRPLGSPRFEAPPVINLIGFILGFLVLPSLLNESLKNGPLIVRIQAHGLFRILFVPVWWLVLWFSKDPPSLSPQESEPPRLPPLDPLRSVQFGGWGFCFSYLPVWILLMAVAPYREPHPLINLLSENPTPSVWMTVVLTAVIAAPAFEEFLFRVILLSSLRQLLDPWRAIFISSAIFAISHSPIDAIPLFPLALVLGYVYHRTGSYPAVFLMHALFNAYNLLTFWLLEVPT